MDIYSLALTKVYGVGPAMAKKLMEFYPSAEDLFNETAAGLEVVFKGRRKTIESILGKSMFPVCERELRFIEDNGIRAYFFTDQDYPERLRRMDDPPVCLFVKGRGSLDADRMVSIVGTRHATDYGKWMTANIVHELHRYGVSTVSGLALGIDSMVHIRSVAEGMPTFGVLGHGLDRIYPSSNWDLAKAMTDRGGLVTEFFSETNLSAYNFPRRNRIIAALCDLCIVVESSRKGGSLITARLAQDYNKEVLAVPGRVCDINSEGCNNLISGNMAADLSNLNRIGEIMNWNVRDAQTANGDTISRKSIPDIPLNDNEKKVYEYIEKNKRVTIDEISSACSIGISMLSSLLMTLELKGFIKALPGKSYEIF